MAFTHLHVHTQYSLLDGAARIGELIACAKSHGMNALAITDHGVLYGVIEFYKACVSGGIKPIIGMEAYVAPRSMEDREGGKDREYAHLILLCKNQAGYKNLMRLSTEAFLHGFYYKPRIDYKLLEECSEGLICLSACLAGDIPQLLLRGDYAGAKALAQKLKAIFKDDFYIELQDHGLDEQRAVLPQLTKLAKETGIKLVATNDVHYVFKEDAPVQDVLLCVQTNSFVDEQNRMRMDSDEFYLKSEEEMRSALNEYPEAIDNTQEIAEKCQLEFKNEEKHLPGFTAPNGIKNSAYLRKLCFEGFKEKMPNADASNAERLEYELSVIENMGFVDYFLIVWDFIDFAKRNGIIVGPGRGSGAGSLAAYCLNITDVDPIKNDLIFERFLNPERISMPDFDIDFCYERRQEVIDYVVQKYGENHVAQIITFGTMAARAAVRDVGRALHMPYGDVDKIAKMVPAELNMTLERALTISPELNLAYNSSSNIKTLIDFSKRLEGQPRHASTHAAGVVISKHPIMEVVPLQKNDESVTTQFPMGTLEELGLLKMDFLGLRTLTVIRDTLDFIDKSGKEVPKLDTMEYNDPEVYAMISKGDTDGVFQLESAGMRQFLMQLKPDSFEDIIAGISLFRPGPMAQIPRYVSAKNGIEPVTYLHEKLQPILKKTYGCIVYQEQVMQIVRDLGGYSLARSDLVRRAMSKKKHEVMAKERQNFIEGNEEEGIPGAINNGVSKHDANKIFDEMMDFASYAFNKSHAASYAVLAYRTAFLKLYYKAEFMAALLNSYLGNADEIAKYVYAARNMGLKVLPPDVNKSSVRFTVEKGAIRFGLCAVRNVGETVMQNVVSERTQSGSFKDFFDFTNRTEGINKRALESLIYAGGFDNMGCNRAQLIGVYERALEEAAQSRRIRDQGQISLFDLGGKVNSAMQNACIRLEQTKEFPRQRLLEKEREAIGVYISGHPLDDYASTLFTLEYTVSQLQEADGSEAPYDNARVQTGGLLSSIERKPTRNGNSMVGYAVLEGISGSIELLLFKNTLDVVSDLFTSGRAVLVNGRLSLKEGAKNSIIVSSISTLKNIKPTLYMRFEALTPERVKEIVELLSGYPGNVPVMVYEASTGEQRLSPKELNVNLSDAFLAKARALAGKENIRISAK